MSTWHRRNGIRGLSKSKRQKDLGHFVEYSSVSGTYEQPFLLYITTYMLHTDSTYIYTGIYLVTEYYVVLIGT